MTNLWTRVGGNLDNPRMKGGGKVGGLSVQVRADLANPRIKEEENF